MHTKIGTLFVVLLLVASAAPARGSVVLRTTVADMSRTADLVVRGEVLLLASRTVEGERTRIVTDLTLRIDEVLKGQLAETTFTVTLPGGRSGDFVMKIPGMPQFRQGEEVVLFLERTSTSYAVSGLQQGKFSILREPLSGQKVALRGYDAGIALATRDRDGALAIEEVDGQGDIRTLDDLRREVRTALERPVAPVAPPVIDRTAPQP